MTSPRPTLPPFCARERLERRGKQHNTLLYVQASSSPSPAPRRRGFPLPLWRGVNGLANYVSLPFPAERGWGCLFGCWRPGHGDPGLLWLAWQITVGRWPPCPVLQQEARVFTPLSYGEGLGVGLFSARRGGGASVLYIYAISEAFSKTHQITV